MIYVNYRMVFVFSVTSEPQPRHVKRLLTLHVKDHRFVFCSERNPSIHVPEKPALTFDVCSGSLEYTSKLPVNVQRVHHGTTPVSLGV